MAEDAYSPWGQLHWAVKTGENAYIKTNNGKSLWEVLKVRALCWVPARLQLVTRHSLPFYQAPTTQ